MRREFITKVTLMHFYFNHSLTIRYDREFNVNCKADGHSSQAVWSTQSSTSSQKNIKTKKTKTKTLIYGKTGSSPKLREGRPEATRRLWRKGFVERNRMELLLCLKF